MKQLLLFTLTVLLLQQCGNNIEGDQSSSEAPQGKLKAERPDDGKGVGPFTSIELNSPLVANMVKSGERIYELKCSACHKLTDQRVVGPGWKGITQKRKPEWIMNMIMNVDVMLAEDAEAQKMLEECLVRMPNQNLSADDARNVLEFIYANDGYAVE